MPVENFTYIANTTLNQWVYNQSFINANQPLTMTTPGIWMAFVVIGISLLILSAVGKSGMVHQDLSGILAAIFLFIAGAGSWAVDTVTGFGVLVSGTRFVLMENHTIYHYDLYGYALGLVWLISLANLYRLFLDYRRVTKQEAMEGDGMRRQGAGGKREPDRDERPRNGDGDRQERDRPER